MKAIIDRVETLCKTKLNAKHLITAINQHELSVINYYIRILNVEPDIYREIDDKIRGILIKHHYTSSLHVRNAYTYLEKN